MTDRRQYYKEYYAKMKAEGLRGPDYHAAHNAKYRTVPGNADSVDKILNKPWVKPALRYP